MPIYHNNIKKLTFNVSEFQVELYVFTKAFDWVDISDILWQAWIFQETDII